MIVVSHDRYFLDRTVRRIFAFKEEGVLEQHEGGYTEYALRKQEELLQESAGMGQQKKTAETTANSRNSWKEGRKKKLRFTFQEQRDYETIEGEIAGLEEKIADIEENIAKAARDFVKLNELTVQKENLEKLLEEKMNRWMYLEDLAAKIEAGEEV